MRAGDFDFIGAVTTYGKAPRFHPDIFFEGPADKMPMFTKGDRIVSLEVQNQGVVATYHDLRVEDVHHGPVTRVGATARQVDCRDIIEGFLLDGEEKKTDDEEPDDDDPFNDVSINF